MSDDSIWRTIAADARERGLERLWDRLCAGYLPNESKNSIWKYRKAENEDLPDCGWKLHVSATILNAPRLLQRVGPLLVESGVQFKAARSLLEVSRLNSGLLHTYSQVGKVITVYPRNDEEAVYLAERLHKLTLRFRSPAVPFDLRFTDNSNVYYRYGAFKTFELELADGTRAFAMPSPGGELVPDIRENPRPDWVVDPFERVNSNRRTRKRRKSNRNSFQVIRAMVQRGKGGVYQAIDVESNPPRLCLLKEGRKNGEMTWDGRDGVWRVRHEERVLASLLRHGIDVPKVYSSFELESNFYLVMEFVDGQSLHHLLLKQTRRLPINRVLSLGIQVADFLHQMHRAGWAWRDCKPKNLIVTPRGKLVPIDFEGASPIRNPDPMLWGTPRFIPTKSFHRAARNGVTDDLYSLGSVLYLLITGRLLDSASPVAIEKLRPKLPPELRDLVSSLLADNPRKRPSAQSTKSRLTAILLKRSPGRMPLADVKAA